MRITVLDFMNYLASIGKPISGFAMSALINGWRPKATITSDTTEVWGVSIQAVEQWKEQSKTSMEG